MQQEPERPPESQGAQIKNEAARAAIRFFELDPTKPHRVVIRELPVTEEDRSDQTRAGITHKFYAVLGNRGQYAALVYRRGEANYLVEEAEETEAEAEAELAREEEAYQVLMTAARYLEVNLREARQVEAEEQQPPAGATYARRWLVTLDGQVCTVVCYKHDSQADGPEYTILE